MRRAVLVALGAGCGLFLGSEEQLALTMAVLERAPPPLALASGGNFQPDRLVLTRQVHEVRGSAATVFAHAEVEGTVDQIRVSYLGPETLRFKRGDGWEVEGAALPGLQGVLEALRGRVSALRAGDVAAYGQLLDDGYSDVGVDKPEALRRLAILAGVDVPVKAWLVRAEREEATVREEYDVGQPPKRDKRAAALFRLVRRGDAWRIAGGLY